MYELSMEVAGTPNSSASAFETLSVVAAELSPSFLAWMRTWLSPSLVTLSESLAPVAELTASLARSS